MNVGPAELMILVLIVLLLFGASRLPKLARSMREAREEFQKGSDEAEAPTPAPPPASPPAPTPPVDNPPSPE